MRKPATAVLLATILLVLLPGVALAHASFDVSQLPADATQDLVLRVPLERDAANDLVEVLVPGAFMVTACPGTRGWSCDQAATAEGDTVVTLTRDADGPGDADRFALTVTAPTEEGVYAFPTIQTYDDGVEAAWIGEAGSDQPAPRIQVGDETAAVEFSGDATPHTDLAPEEDGAGASPSPSAEPSAPASPAADEPAADEPPAQATPEAAPTGDALGTERAGDEGAGPSATLLTVGLVLVAVAAAVVALRRRSR